MNTAIIAKSCLIQVEIRSSPYVNRARGSHTNMSNRLITHSYVREKRRQMIRLTSQSCLKIPVKFELHNTESKRWN